MPTDMEEKINILITDDSPAKLETIAAIIEDDDLNIVKTTSGEDAVKKAKTELFALIIMDVRMPGVDGYEAAHIIRSSTCNDTTPIIFVSETYTGLEYIFKGYINGAVDYLTTPIIPRILKSKVRVFVDLFKKNRKLEQLVKRQEKFYSVVAHDLRGPFHPILGFIDLLIRDFENMSKEEIKSYLEMIDGSAKNIFQLLNDLLELTRLKSDDYIFTSERVGLYDVSEKVTALLANTATAKRIELINLADRSCCAIANANMLGTVIQNLVANAIKFTPAGGIITISTNLEQYRCELIVTDTGAGIEPSNLDKLFDPNVKFTTRGTAGETGTGLGLSICKELVEKQNGLISVTSELGKGTAFTIFLPWDK
jgi:signal transduction histidine kinase